MFSEYYLFESTVDEIKKSLAYVKTVIFFAGLPGGGKTYYTNKNFPGVNILDTDEIAMDLAQVKDRENITDEEKEKIRQNTSKAIKNRKDEAHSKIQSGENFIYMGTMANQKGIENMINFAKEHGYKTGIIYINVSVDTALKQNEKRIEDGGRGLPPEVAAHKIPKSYERIKQSINNLRNQVDYYLEVRQ
jgi:predicted kinase